MVVHIRLRPFLESELQGGAESCVETFEEDANQLTIHRPFDEKNFAFDHIFMPESTQPEVYNLVGKPTIDVGTRISGYSCLVIFPRAL